MADVIKNFDIFQKKPRLYLSGKDTFPTKYGIVTGTLTLITSFAFIFYFIVDYYQRNNINLIQRSIIDQQPRFDFNSSPFIFSLQNFQGQILKPSHYYFNLYMFYYKLENKGASVKVNLDLEKCNINKHFGNYTYLFESFDLEYYYCMKPGQETKNMTVYGNFGDMQKGYTFVNLYVSKCKNGSMYNTDILTCADQTEIDDLLDKTIYLRLAHVDFDIFHNKKDPIVPILRTDALQITTKFNPRIYYNMKNVVYRTDNGILGENFEEIHFTSYDKFSNILSINPFLIPESFSLFSLLVSPIGNNYTRSYIKLQTLMANIGGVVNALIIIMKFVSFSISNKIIMAYQINKIFDLANSNFMKKIPQSEINIFADSNQATTHKKSCNLKTRNFCKNENLKFYNKADINNVINVNSKPAFKKSLQLSFKEIICPKIFFKGNPNFEEFSKKIKKLMSRII